MNVWTLGPRSGRTKLIGKQRPMLITNTYRSRRSDATNREAFYRAHPHGYHDKYEQDKHYRRVGDAYGEYTTASDKQKNHERYRS